MKIITENHFETNDVQIIDINYEHISLIEKFFKVEYELKTCAEELINDVYNNYERLIKELICCNVFKTFEEAYSTWVIIH